MVHVEDISVGFLLASGILGLILLAFSVNAYRRLRDSHMAFVAGAFTVFTIKSFLVAYGLKSGAMEHQLLELVDAIGDMATVLLFVLPLVWPPRKNDALD